MQLPKGATVAVADGEKLLLFRNGGDEADLDLKALPHPKIGSENNSSGSRHESSAANPDNQQLEHDSFAAASAAWLNQQVLSNKIDKLVIVAAPRTLGELRKHYHKQLESSLLREIDKDLTGQSIAEIGAALSRA